MHEDEDVDCESNERPNGTSQMAETNNQVAVKRKGTLYYLQYPNKCNSVLLTETTFIVTFEIVVSYFQLRCI